MNAPSVSWACFASPVSLEMPVGEDPAYDPEFLRLGKELESGGSVQGRVTNWAFVEAECSRILRERAKDVRAASWLVVAKANLSGWSGAADGLSGYAAFVERFWSAAHPRRARGRVGFVAWLWDGLARALGEHLVRPADRAVLCEVEALVAQLDASFDALLNDANPGATSFKRLVRERIASLPDDESPSPVAFEEPAPAPVAPLTDDEVTDAASDGADGNDATESSTSSADPTPHSAEDLAPSPDPDESLTEPHGPSDEGRSLEAIVSRALAQAPGRERFLTVLQAATIARQHADTEVAQALLDRLLPEIDATLVAWEPGACLAFFEEYLRTIDARDDQDASERASQRGYTFRRLLALNPALALRLRASREGV